MLIKNKYYPFAILILMNLFAFPRLDMLAAVILGYVEYRWFAGMLIRPSKVNYNIFTSIYNYTNTIKSNVYNH